MSLEQTTQIAGKVLPKLTLVIKPKPEIKNNGKIIVVIKPKPKNESVNEIISEKIVPIMIPVTTNKTEGALTLETILHENPSKPVWHGIMEQNWYDLKLLRDIMERKIQIRKHTDYFRMCTERLSGQWHFSTISHNIRVGNAACKHGCIYCYVSPTEGFDRYKRKLNIIDIESPMPVDVSKTRKNFSKVIGGARQMYFFPSSSDIFVENMNDYVNTCHRILTAGHEVLFVTKPTMQSITEFIRLIEHHHDVLLFKKGIAVFITISTDNNQLIEEYEPHASLYEVRVSVIDLLMKHGFNTNIMMEPYLSDPIPLIKKVLPLITSNTHQGIISLGQMNYVATTQRIKCSETRLQYLTDLYSRQNIHKLWEFIKTEDRVFPKKQTVTAILKSL